MTFDPVTDTMGDRIEEKLRSLLLAKDDLAELRVVFRGEAGFVPVDLFPFGTIFLSMESDAVGQEGYGQETGFRHIRYDGYVSVEALLKDAPGLAQQLRRGARSADVPSYLFAKRLTQAVKQSLLGWGGLDGRRVEEDPVISHDEKEVTVELRVDTITNALQQRPDNVSNRGNVEFHIYTRRQDF